MTTPMLEPVLAPPPASSPPSAARESAPEQRPFRELLAPPHNEAQPEELEHPPAGTAPTAAGPAAGESNKLEPSPDSEEEDAFAEAGEAPVAVDAMAQPAPVPEAPQVDEVADADTLVETPEAANKTPRAGRHAPLPGKLDAQPAGNSASVDGAPQEPSASNAADTAQESPTVEVAPAAPPDAAVQVAPEQQIGTTPGETPNLEQADNALPLPVDSPIVRDARSPRDGRQGEAGAKASKNTEQLSAATALGETKAAPLAEVSDRPKDSMARKREKREETVEKSAASLTSELKGTASAATADAPGEHKPPSSADPAPARSETPSPAAQPLAASNERLGAMLGRRRAPAGGEQAQPLSDSQQARLVQRVARAFDTARLRGEPEIRLRLSPPELGSLKLEVRMESGMMTARLEVETVSAQQALADNLGALRQRLAEQNIRVGQFDIELRDRQSGGSPDPQTNPFAGQDRQTGERGHSRPQSQSRVTNQIDGAPTSRTTAIASSGSLDVLI